MKTVAVSKDMWKQLHEYKLEGNFRNVNELLKWVLLELERYQNLDKEVNEVK